MARSLPHPDSYPAYAFLQKDGDLQRITVPWRDPTEGEIVVKILACGVCGSDEAARGTFRIPIQYPRIPGHEIVGDVVAIPATEKIWTLGQRVGGGWHGGHCLSCSRCRVGDYITCEKKTINGTLRDGGYAEYAILRSEAVAALPDDLDPAEAAPLLCAAVTCFNALRHMNARPPDYVAVQGIGGLGHLALQIAKAMGFRVIALSSGPGKESLARSLGAHEYVDGSKVDQAEALRALGGAKVIMCTAPSSDAAQKLIPGLAVDGTLLLLMLESEPMTISPTQLLGKRLSIRGWAVGHATDSEDCVAFARTHDVKCLVEKFPLEKAQEAYNRRSSAKFRAVIVPGLTA
ncbi:GroES-like protein [Dichomitus squalens LYAD-421 SS1]|uniref:GroES-like protein n=1 Tax=Dichomitus squalens (strain LYAD-421) TaxID=732165 RepID=R7SZP7_DICSQ|nr:GroES-like protein [Dichomitus squalens LYAD-421 SS1]EJF61443.1 GroES-like protein [Dichomitus squalens LYAD-421 SS1]